MDAEGYFHCAHCKRVVEVSLAEEAAALDGPSGRLVDLRCPRCRHCEVSWHAVSQPRPRPVPAKYRPVSDQRAAELFAAIRRSLN